MSSSSIPVPESMPKRDSTDLAVVVANARDGDTGRVRALAAEQARRAAADAGRELAGTMTYHGRTTKGGIVFAHYSAPTKSLGDPS